MSISARVVKARELLSTALQQIDHPRSTTVNYEHKLQHHSDLLSRRKCYYKQIKASKMLSRLASDPSFRDSTAMNQWSGVGCVREVDNDRNKDEHITTAHVVECDSHDKEMATTSSTEDQPEAPPVTSIDCSELPTIEPTLCEQVPDDHSDLNVTEDIDSDIVFSHNSINKLNVRGFHAIKELIARNKSILHNVELRDPETRKTSNAAYCYDDAPFEGWRKEISVRMSGKSQGSLDIHYISKNRRRRFRSKNEIARYLSQNHLPLSDINRFEFRSVFCVCHSAEDTSRNFLECSFGKTGCNRWMHPECVGLGFRTEHELKLLPRVTCPFCSAYLTETGELSELSNQQPIM